MSQDELEKLSKAINTLITVDNILRVIKHRTKSLPDIQELSNLAISDIEDLIKYNKQESRAL